MRSVDNPSKTISDETLPNATPQYFISQGIGDMGDRFDGNGSCQTVNDFNAVLNVLVFYLIERGSVRSQSLVKQR